VFSSLLFAFAGLDRIRSLRIPRAGAFSASAK
jgi:hypothetical protein